MELMHIKQPSRKLARSLKLLLFSWDANYGHSSYGLGHSICKDIKVTDIWILKKFHFQHGLTAC